MPGWVTSVPGNADWGVCMVDNPSRSCSADPNFGSAVVVRAPASPQGRSHRDAERLGTGKVFLLALCLCASVVFFVAANQIPPSNGIIDSPSITIAGAAATSASSPTTGTASARVIWAFGTVSGTYTGCTAQAQTSYDGTSFINLGGAAPLTVTSSTINAWGIYELPLTASVQFPADTSGIAVTPVSTNVATSFGQSTRFSFACASYGTSAPVTITVIYR